MQFPKPIAEAVKEVFEERRRGSWWCLGRIVKGILEACTSNEVASIDRDRLADAIQSANPSMASLRVLADIVRSSRDLCETIRRFEIYMENARKKLVENVRSFLRGRIVTISFSSAVADAILSNRDLVDQVIALESSPGSEGIDLYEHLSRNGAKVKLVPDSMIAYVVEESNLVLLGADAVDLDGNIVNKIGSRTLAIVARELGKPVLVLAEAVKLIDVPSRELATLVRRRFRISCYELELPVFECVESKYVDAIVTDLGVAKPRRSELVKIRGKFLEFVLASPTYETRNTAL